VGVIVEIPENGSVTLPNRARNKSPGTSGSRLQTGVGHYGVFSGRRWNNEVYPVLRDIIQMTN
jgi:poly-beta-hydroxyalkanoate depolymerase